MRKTVTSITVAALAFLCVAQSVYANGADDSKVVARRAIVNPSGFPLVKEQITVKGLALTSPQGGDHTNSYGWKEYEKMTGIHMEWSQVAYDVAEERKNILLAANDLPEVFYAMPISDADLIKYGSIGTFLKLNDFIDAYAPNLKKLMAENPELKRGITMPDGNIYSMPYIQTSQHFAILKMYTNKQWLQNVGMKMPTTLDEFTNLLRAYRDQDANKNGLKDEIPFAIRWNPNSTSGSMLIQTMQGFFGLGTRGNAHPLVDWDDKADALRFIPSAPQYKDLLMYLNKLYAEKLLDNEVFTTKSSRDIVGKFSKKIVGVHADYTTNAGPDLQDLFIPIPLFTGAYGQKQWTRVQPSIVGKGAFVLTNKCANPEAMVRWADYLYSEPGQLMYWLGFEGVTHKVVNGEYEYTDELLHNPDGLTLTQAQRKYLLFQWGPGVISDKYFKGAETYWTSVEGTKSYAPYIPKTIWNGFTMTLEESQEMAALQSDLKAYVDEMTASFIIGRKSFDQWDAYLAEFKNLQLERYLALYKSLYTRYSSAK